ncbi:MAG: TIGR03619 family F420-dependent LLM class oxidoreductase [Actinobacteria bacterium]|nr:TIGR03619 family F420-dependent LLM class oxidoreductase [Actinomycetota bacterium]MSW91199.1 TIGR03619 family F420-dependent LLM class oxidoreductase [Actinomycetota bacterium]MSY72218.1 TIGR03619 family F420-dependent LLM class oxidoreductase [Actinomycetota bacterium]
MSQGTAVPQLSTTLVNFREEDPGSWRFLLDRAVAADRAGIDRLVVSDHVVYGENTDEYAKPEVGGSKGGKQPTTVDGQWLEPLTLLSVVAGITTRVRLGTNILLASLRRPVVLAKTLSTLDVLSDGRVDLGVGVGWQREEYDAAGLSFDGRGKLLDHTLSVLQTLWTEKRASFKDGYLEFDAIHQMPKPRQSGGVPIWVSGTTNKLVARRIVQFGSGWIPWGDSAVDITTGIAQMRDLVEAAGGTLDGKAIVGNLRPVKATTGGVDLAATMAAVPEFVAAGVTDCRMPINVSDDASEAFDTYSATVEAFRAATT